jgi:hypothetical protein
VGRGTFRGEKLAHAPACLVRFGWELGRVELKSLHGLVWMSCGIKCTAFSADAGAPRCVP